MTRDLRIGIALASVLTVFLIVYWAFTVAGLLPVP